MRNEVQWTDTGADTGNVLSGNGAAAGFSIDYERAPQAVTDLEHAAEFFRDRAKQAERLANIPNNPILEVAYHKERNLRSFELTKVSGYPAIVSRTNADLPICDIDVEPAERQSFSLMYESPEFGNNPQQSCEVGKQVAAAVLMKLPLES